MSRRMLKATSLKLKLLPRESSPSLGGSDGMEDVLLEREANPDENMPAKFDEDDFVRTSVRGASMPRPKNRGALARSSSWLEL